MSSYGLYVIGYVVLIGGLAYAASLLGVSQTWIVVGAVILLGIGIITGVTRARRPDTPPSSGGGGGRGGGVAGGGRRARARRPDPPPSSVAPVERERVIERR